jgi:hypothetical protein
MFVDWDWQWDYDVDGDVIVVTLDIGDNFVINAEAGNSKNADIWLICYTKPFHQVRRTFTNKWGTSFIVGDVVVAGLYYQRWGHWIIICIVEGFTCGLYACSSCTGYEVSNAT